MSDTFRRRVDAATSSSDSFFNFDNTEPLLVNMKLESKVSESIDSMPSMLSQVKSKLQSGKLSVGLVSKVDVVRPRT